MEVDTKGHSGVFNLGVMPENTAGGGAYKLSVSTARGYQLLKAGSSLEVNHQNGEITITWQKASVLPPDNPAGATSPAGLRYTVYVVGSSVLSAYKAHEVPQPRTVCGLEQVAAQCAVRSDLSGTSLTLQQEELAAFVSQEDSEYFINVVVECDNQCMGGDPQKQPYQMQRFESSPGATITKEGSVSGGTVAAIIGGVSALVLIAGGVILVYRRKAAGLEKRLDYEMSDIRNIGNVRSGMDPAQAQSDDNGRESSLMSDIGDGKQEVGNPLKNYKEMDLEIDENAI